MNRRLKLLLTNDDGIAAKGMDLLVSSLLQADFADIYIVAPSSQQSGTSMSFSYSHPVSIEPYHYHQKVHGAWVVSGSPVDCMKLALGNLFNSDLPDLVISGINHGTNAGRNIFYSGTVGAATEAILFGIPALALSQDQHISFFQETAAPEILKSLSLYITSSPFPCVIGLNVNFPASNREEPWKGLRLVATGNEFATSFPRLVSTEGKKQFFSLHDCRTRVDGQPSEEYLSLLDNYISVAPLFVRNSPLAVMGESDFQEARVAFSEFFNAEKDSELSDV
ncbi:5'/3'-nucleotidase SurE [Chlamydia ibidis]|uniref:5'-nucleotidase SurE n=2 Tax=Chlamydia ibidis TaxID=1405396 RepID=S7KKY9_9CHLA|nr:5'/3'-nucleotidase SurE [Chlamydia ibidis]EPP35115.1 5'/3'-nucleotidase SurE [Chlamydia ibidis]EQM62802.1 5'/3'-nucleotidase SurE [Chlamydia ibidis 10-1398/6]